MTMASVFTTIHHFLEYMGSTFKDQVKLARLRRAGHVQRMKNDEMVKRIMEGKPEGTKGSWKTLL